MYSGGLVGSGSFAGSAVGDIGVAFGVEGELESCG